MRPAFRAAKVAATRSSTARPTDTKTVTSSRRPRRAAGHPRSAQLPIVDDNLSPAHQLIVDLTPVRLVGPDRVDMRAWLHGVIDQHRLRTRRTGADQVRAGRGRPARCHSRVASPRSMATNRSVAAGSRPCSRACGPVPFSQKIMSSLAAMRCWFLVTHTACFWRSPSCAIPRRRW